MIESGSSLRSECSSCSADIQAFMRNVLHWLPTSQQIFFFALPSSCWRWGSYKAPLDFSVLGRFTNPGQADIFFLVLFPEIADQLPAWFLRLAAPSISSRFLTHLSNQFFARSHVSSQWKITVIHPIAKVDKLSAPADFRPISIVTVTGSLSNRREGVGAYICTNPLMILKSLRSLLIKGALQLTNSPGKQCWIGLKSRFKRINRAGVVWKSVRRGQLSGKL